MLIRLRSGEDREWTATTDIQSLMRASGISTTSLSHPNLNRKVDNNHIYVKTNGNTARPDNRAM